MFNIADTKKVKYFLLRLAIFIAIDILVWFITSKSWRHELMDIYTLSTPNLFIDFGLGVIESVIILITGEYIGKTILDIAVKRKMEYLSCIVSILLTFFCMWLISVGISYTYYKIFNYYTFNEFRQSISILTAISSMFVLETMLEKYITLYKKHIDSSHEAEKELLNAKNIALKTELNNMNLRADTHFIFNGLSVLRELMEEGRNEQAAKKFISQLIAVSKYISTTSNQSTCPLDDELTLLDNYFSLMRVRFPEGLILNVDKALYDVSGEIPPVSLTSLVANAIKHNAHVRSKPLSIQICLDKDTIVVSNKIQKLISMTESTGMGLSLLRQQYEVLNDHRMEVSNDGVIFSVRIPILNFEKS